MNARSNNDDDSYILLAISIWFHISIEENGRVKYRNNYSLFSLGRAK